MSESEAIVMDWTVMEILAGGKYKIQLHDIDMIVEWYASGKMRKHRIKIIIWDSIQVELNPYEPKKWRILFREKDKKISKEMVSKFDTMTQRNDQPKSWIKQNENEF
jgi:translation initiation factor IF-1